MSDRERQRLADIQAAIDAIRSHLQRGRPCPDDARWSLPLDGTELLPVYTALYEVCGDIPHFPVGVL